MDRKIDLEAVFKQAQEEVFQEGVTEAVKKVKHLLYKESHLEHKIKIAESVIKKTTDKLTKTKSQLEAIQRGEYAVLNNINMKEDFTKEEQLDQNV